MNPIEVLASRQLPQEILEWRIIHGSHYPSGNKRNFVRVLVNQNADDAFLACFRSSIERILVPAALPYTGASPDQCLSNCQVAAICRSLECVSVVAPSGPRISAVS